MRTLLIAFFVVAGWLAPAHSDAGADVEQRRAEVARSADSRRAVEVEQQRLAERHGRLAAAIDFAKREPASPGHDARLGELLAQAKVTSDALDAQNVQLRSLDDKLAAARRALVAACDRALASDISGARRVELARLRTAQVTLLVAPPSADARVASAALVQPLDGPREILEKADLLRDSGDKLRREAQRIGRRLDDVERRRHLRERAAAVDEDLFADSAITRRSARPTTLTGAGTRESRSDAAPQAAGGTNGFTGTPSTPAMGAGGGGATSGSSPSPSTAVDTSKTDSVVLRNLVDPSTLEELRRADAGDDLERQLRAWKRAQSELEALARDVDQRAQSLSARAAELRQKK